MRKFLPIIIIIGLVFGAGSTLAYVMSSPNYRIQSDSINIGGLRQASPNYRLEDTIGEIATGVMVSPSYKLKAGYQQMQEIYLSISAPADVTMSPNIGGVFGGISNGSTTWTVITDNPAGYTLLIRASTTPALEAPPYSFADYTPAIAGTPDFDWSIPATTSEFGFTPEGKHIVPKFRDNGLACSIGTQVTPNMCWYNFSTLNEIISQSYFSNHPFGTDTKVRFRAESGSANIQPVGTYQATIIVTALSN